MPDLSEFGGSLCRVSVSLSLLSITMCALLKYDSTLPTATFDMRRYTADPIYKIHLAFLGALFSTSFGIYFHNWLPWGVWLPLIGLVASVMWLRNIDPWEKGWRLFSLMVVALFAGISLVRLLDVAYPIQPCLIVCLLWTMALPYMVVQVIAQLFTTELRYFFIFTLHASGFTILLISYVAAAFFGISGMYFRSKLLFFVQMFAEIIWWRVIRRSIPRFEDEDIEEYVLQTLYLFLSFMDMSILVILLLLE